MKFLISVGLFYPKALVALKFSAEERLESYHSYLQLWENEYVE